MTPSRAISSVHPMSVETRKSSRRLGLAVTLAGLAGAIVLAVYALPAYLRWAFITAYMFGAQETGNVHHIDDSRFLWGLAFLLALPCLVVGALWWVFVLFRSRTSD
jgi:H+/Cl- antiporter ClcA